MSSIALFIWLLVCQQISLVHRLSVAIVIALIDLVSICAITIGHYELGCQLISEPLIFLSWVAPV